MYVNLGILTYIEKGHVPCMVVSRLLFWFAMQKKGAVPASLISCNVVDIFINKVMSWFALGFADIPADKGLGFGLCTLKVPDMSQRVFPACQRIPVGSK